MKSKLKNELLQKCFWAHEMKVLKYIFRPFVRLFVWLSVWLTKIFACFFLHEARERVISFKK